MKKKFFFMRSDLRKLSNVFSIVTCGNGSPDQQTAGTFLAELTEEEHFLLFIKA
jgi:hypothetical protein